MMAKFTQLNLDSEWKSLDSHLSSFRDCLQFYLHSMYSRRESLDSREKALDSRERSLDSREKSLDLREKALVEKEEALDSKEKALIGKHESLAVRERTLLCKETLLISKENSGNSKQKGVSTEGKAINSRGKELVSRDEAIMLKSQEAPQSFQIGRKHSWTADMQNDHGNVHSPAADLFDTEPHRQNSTKRLRTSVSTLTMPMPIVSVVEGNKIIEESSERGKPEEARGDKKEKDNMHDGAETARFNHNYEKTKIDGSGGCYETTIYPDPEFTDFGKMRAEECFDVGQLWAVYDNSIDGMPRFYAQVRRVFSPVFKLSITWLEPDPDDGAETDGKAGDRPYACGNFTYGTSNLISERLIFSHQVCFRNDENGRSFVIYPHVGETWAVSLSWDINWKSNFDCHKAPHRFEFVEILSEFNVSDGIKFAKLKKVEGFVSLFHKAEEHGSFQISPSEILRFSHQIPSSKMTGKEREGVPEGSFELDPASLPADVYGTVAFSDAEKTDENLASGFNALCGCNDLGSSPKMQTTSRSDKIDSEVDKLKQRSAVKSSDRRKKRNQDNASQHLNLGARNKDSKASLGKCNNQGESKLDALCQAVDILEETKNC